MLDINKISDLKLKCRDRNYNRYSIKMKEILTLYMILLLVTIHEAAENPAESFEEEK